MVAFTIAACGKKKGATSDAGGSISAIETDSGAIAASDAAAQVGAPRRGMVWIPAGVLRAGTPESGVPRIAEEELDGDEIPLGGFYVDVYPYPNEAGAIPTVNVTRDDAAHLCEARGERLCTELEWERSCKGAKNNAYAYGDTYRANACGTGVSAEESAKRPVGERVACKSDFGVMDMHGEAWEWTASAWGRGSKDASLGVLRGGNAVAGEIVDRCANASGRNTSTKSATMGFRCCAGAANAAAVDLELKTGAPLVRSAHAAETSDALVELASHTLGDDVGLSAERAWTWHPVANEELIISIACRAKHAPVRAGSRCALVVGRVGSRPEILANVSVGADPPDVAEIGEARRMRMRGLDMRGTFSREITYAYGRVIIGDAKRP